MYPRLVINREGLYENARLLLELCRKRGVRLQAVVKALSGRTELIRGLADLGVESFGDARLDNLACYSQAPGEKWLIRPPMLSELDRLLALTDGCLVSEEAALLDLERAAGANGRHYQVLLMAELGDLREGCLEGELTELALLAESLPHLQLKGIGANLSCYGEILPDERNMAELVRLTELAEKAIGRALPVISGGNSSSYLLLAEGRLPRRINELRMGESWLLGNVPCHNEPIVGYWRHNFRLEAEITELKEKPSLPYGKRGGRDSFGGHREFVDQGLRRRALLTLGKQDVYLSGLTPLDRGVSILGGSSDCLICDVTDSPRDLRVGSVLGFGCDYAAMALAMASAHVEKILE